MTFEEAKKAYIECAPNLIVAKARLAKDHPEWKAQLAGWDESKHPRVQSGENGGEFSKASISVEHSKGYDPYGKRGQKSYLAKVNGPNIHTDDGLDKEFLSEADSTDWGDYDARKGKGTFTHTHKVGPGYYEKSEYGEKTHYVARKEGLETKLSKTSPEKIKMAHGFMDNHDLDFDKASRLAAVSDLDRRNKILSMVKNDDVDFYEALAKTKPAT